MPGSALPHDTIGRGRGRTVGRRRVLTAAGTALAVGLAGCSEATSQEFAASPVRLVVEDLDGEGDDEFAYTVRGTREGHTDKQVVREPSADAADAPAPAED